MLPRQLPSTTQRWRLLARTQFACGNCAWPRKPSKPKKPRTSKRPIKPLPGDVVQQKARQAEPDRGRAPDVRGPLLCRKLLFRGNLSNLTDKKAAPKGG